MKTNSDNQPYADHEEIAKLARQIWEREGRQSGRDMHYWLQAERQVLAGGNRADNPPRQTSAAGSSRAGASIKPIRLPDSPGRSRYQTQP
jgi:hypothetical protein